MSNVIEEYSSPRYRVENHFLQTAFEGDGESVARYLLKFAEEADRNNEPTLLNHLDYSTFIRALAFLITYNRIALANELSATTASGFFFKRLKSGNRIKKHERVLTILEEF